MTLKLQQQVDYQQWRLQEQAWRHKQASRGQKRQQKRQQKVTLRRPVNTSFTTTGLATLATPATGLYLRVYKVLVEAYVTTVLAGATVGDPLVVCDNAIANVVGIGRIAGATTATRAGIGASIAGSLPIGPSLLVNGQTSTVAAPEVASPLPPTLHDIERTRPG